MLVIRRQAPRNLVDIVVDQDHLLRRQIRDGVDPFRICRMIFSHRQFDTCAVFSPCPGKDDLCLPVIFPARFEQYQCPPTIDVEILNRIPDAIDMIHLACKVEDDLLPFDQIIHRMGIPHVTEIDMDLVLDPFHIKEIPSQAGHHVIHNRHRCPEFDQSRRQIRPDKA